MDRGPTRAGRARALRVLLALAVGAALLVPATAAAKVRVIPASADAGVSAKAPKVARGSAKTLTVDGDPASRAYLRFRLTGLSKRLVTQATVWVHLARKERWRGVQAATTNGKAWSERRLTWRTRPAAAPPVGSVVAARGRWKKIDVTGLVRNNGRVDLVLTSTRTSGVVLDSSDRSDARAPRLHLVTRADQQPAFPLRTAVYDSGFPDEWSTAHPIAHPARGRYDEGRPTVVSDQLGDLAYGNFQAAMTTWDGPDTTTDDRLTQLLAATGETGSGLRWAAEDTAEVTGRPTRSEIAARLLALDVSHGRDPSYLRVQGRPVVFVPVGTGDGCGALRRWVAGNARQRVYLVFQTWPGFEACSGAKPSDWWAVTPDAGPVRVRRSSYAISPGFFTASETAARKPRDLPGWYEEIRGMAGSGARFQIVDSYNGWATGTAVEPAAEWASTSGHGQYLDALHANGTAPPDTTTVAAAVGDIGCSIPETEFNDGSSAGCQAAATADLVNHINPSFVITMGDDMHGQATLDDYTAGYDPFWGRFKSITYPAVGNHQYCAYNCDDPVAAVKAGYFTYWGARAGTSGQGWYSYDQGGWHMIVLNSECKEQGGCDAGSPMETWLEQDLAAHPNACTLAYWHRPRFTGGREGEAPSMGRVWRDLYKAGVELVLNGHQHEYERFRPQDPDRQLDLSGGITEIVSGTGGKSHIAPVTVRPNMATENHDTYGVIRLELHPLSWSARFMPAPGLGSYADTVSGDCH